MSPFNKIQPKASVFSVRNSYKELLQYYYANKGKKSEHTGAIITNELISTIEIRYEQLGGKPIGMAPITIRNKKNGISKRNQYRRKK